VPLGPEARYEQSEAISLAFVAALQVLPPRQVAVLILRDVLGFHASEVAGMLEVTVQSVNSALKRARREPAAPAAAARRPPAAARRKLTRRGRDRGLVRPRVGVGRSRRAGGPATDDVFIAMPPVPFGYEGRDVVARYCASLFSAGAVRPRADPSQRPARVRAYLRAPAGIRHATASGAHPGRRPDLRHDPLRGQRAAVVRAAAITPDRSRPPGRRQAVPAVPALRWRPRWCRRPRSCLPRLGGHNRAAA